MTPTLESLVQTAVRAHTPEELALGWLRYEALRRTTPARFLDLHTMNLAGRNYDELVTEELLKWKEHRP